MGAVIKLDLKDLGAALDRGERRIRRAVSTGTLAGAHRGRAVIVRRTPTDMGQLKASWKVKPGAPEFDGTSATLAELINDAPHISMVELGSRPHGVSPEGWLQIYEWVRRHYRGGKLGGKGRMRAQRRSTVEESRPFRGPDPVITDITNALTRRIKREGTKPSFFVRNSTDELRAVMAAELEIAMAKAERGTGKGSR